MIKRFGKARAIICVMFLTGCASHKSAQITEHEQPAAPDQMVVETSQGTAVIEPTVVGYKEETYEDPLEFINRPIFTFNDYLYRYFLIPVGKGYNAVMPDVVHSKISNFFSNLSEPLSALNHLVQGQGKESANSLGRFVVNSTVGLLGLFDPADAWFGLSEQQTNLDETLRDYDVGYGAFLVLPVVGQSDFRNLFSTIAEAPLAPIRHATDEPQTTYFLTWEAIHGFSQRADLYLKLRDESDDPYSFFRNLYMQDLLRDQQYPASPASINKQRENLKDNTDGE